MIDRELNARVSQAFKIESYYVTITTFGTGPFEDSIQLEQKLASGLNKAEWVITRSENIPANIFLADQRYLPWKPER
jgi:hypothetical protein